MRPTRRTLFPLLLLSSLLTPALAQIDTFRATVEGSLHQCASSELFFFDSGAARPLSVLFLPTDNLPVSASDGTVQLADALSCGPLLALGDIETADAAGYEFTIQLEAGAEVAVSRGCASQAAADGRG